MSRRRRTTQVITRSFGRWPQTKITPCLPHVIVMLFVYFWSRLSHFYTNIGRATINSKPFFAATSVAAKKFFWALVAGSTRFTWPTTQRAAPTTSQSGFVTGRSWPTWQSSSPTRRSSGCCSSWLWRDRLPAETLRWSNSTPCTWTRSRGISSGTPRRSPCPDFSASWRQIRTRSSIVYKVSSSWLDFTWRW